MQEKDTVVDSLVEVMGCGMGWIRFVGISRVPSLALAMIACLTRDTPQYEYLRRARAKPLRVSSAYYAGFVQHMGQRYVSKTANPKGLSSISTSEILSQMTLTAS